MFIYTFLYFLHILSLRCEIIKWISAISDPSTTNQQMEDLIDRVVDGLFSVCATLSVVPVIRCFRDNAAEQVAMVG